MSDQTTDTQEASQMNGSQINILAQYVRDISFENPLAPDSLRLGRANPDMDINIGVDARKIPDDKIENMYETVLNLRATATDETEGRPLFLIELQYGVTVVLNDVPEENHHPVLLIEIPRLAFPFLRQIITDLTSQGGFPPLMLNPVDFHKLYMDRFKGEIEAAQKQVVATAEEGDKKSKKADDKADKKDKTAS
jgi:preprotein translocase subunit SecB